MMACNDENLMLASVVYLAARRIATEWRFSGQQAIDYGTTGGEHGMQPAGQHRHGCGVAMKSILFHRKVAGTNAVVFFIFWLLVLLAGADKPPPPGFFLLVLVVAVCAGVVSWRVPTYLEWRRTRRPGRYWRVVLDGYIAGSLVALPFALRGSGEPSITMQAIDYVIWFGVLGMVGVVNSVTIYFLNRVSVK
jgi:hypothetical protein